MRPNEFQMSGSRRQAQLACTVARRLRPNNAAAAVAERVGELKDPKAVGRGCPQLAETVSPGGA